MTHMQNTIMKSLPGPMLLVVQGKGGVLLGAAVSKEWAESTVPAQAGSDSLAFMLRPNMQIISI